MKILLLSAYDAMSHRYWHQQLTRGLPDIDWTVLTLPPRYFAWRVRGNSLSWAYQERAVLEQEYDLVIATSMCDVVGLKGLVPSLARRPWLVYFHENQFAYPPSEQQQQSVEPQLLSIYNALAADKVLFNTHYNRATFLAGSAALLKKLPDHVPVNLVERIDSNSDVLAVPLKPTALMKEVTDKDDGRLVIVWNHRWEYDKGPELLLEGLRALKQRCAKQGTALQIELNIVGQQFRRVPKSFSYIKEEFSEHINHWGYIGDVEAYRGLLARADVALSTALHDFQGIAVLEAVAAGAIPVVPNRLAYPEIFGEAFCYSVENDQAGQLALMLQQLLASKLADKMPAAPSVERFSAELLLTNYRQQICKLVL